MPERETRFSVNAPPADLWRFLRDFESLCGCIPGVERMRVVDARTVELTVKEKVGVVPMIVDLVATVESEAPPKSLRATARAQHLTMDIEVDLHPEGGGTALRTLFRVTGEGPLKPMVDRLFEKRATERAAQFAASLEQRFGGAPPPGAVAPEAAAPAAAEQGLLARFLAWIRRLAGRAAR